MEPFPLFTITIVLSPLTEDEADTVPEPVATLTLELEEEDPVEVITVVVFPFEDRTITFLFAGESEGNKGNGCSGGKRTSATGSGKWFKEGNVLETGVSGGSGEILWSCTSGTCSVK